MTEASSILSIITYSIKIVLKKMEIMGHLT